MNVVKFRKQNGVNPFDEAFDSLFKDWSGSWGAKAVVNKSVSPRTEIKEDNNNFYLTLELPGVKKEDLKVNIENGTLSIKGTKNKETKTENENILMSERYYGEFSRSFNLSKDIKTDSIDAEFKDGILNIVLPKVEEAKPVVKEVNIK